MKLQRKALFVRIDSTRISGDPQLHILYTQWFLEGIDRGNNETTSVQPLHTSFTLALYSHLCGTYELNLHSHQKKINSLFHNILQVEYE